MKRWKIIFGHAIQFLGLYLEDLLMSAGGACFVAAAALRWGEAGGLAVAGAVLVMLSVLVAKSGKR